MAELFEAGGSEPEPSAQTDGTAVSLALARRSRRKRGAGDNQVDTFLAKQEMLIDKQAAYLDAQMAHMRLKHFDERLSVALKLGIAAVGLLIVVGVAAMAWAASRDSRVVIDPIRAPTDLAQQGSDPAAPRQRVAGQGQRAAGQAGSSCVHPGAGDEAARAEGGDPGHRGFGRRDSMRRCGVGSATPPTFPARCRARCRDLIAARSCCTSDLGGGVGKRLVQPDGVLDALLTKGAEQVFAELDPLPYVNWLLRQKRRDEAMATLKTLTLSGPPEQRAEAYQQFAGITGVAMPLAQRRELQAKAMALTNGRIGSNDFYVVENYLGHMESALRGWTLAARTETLDTRRLLTEEYRKRNHLITLDNAAIVTGDNAAAFGLACFEFRSTLRHSAIARPDHPGPGQGAAERQRAGLFCGAASWRGCMRATLALRRPGRGLAGASARRTGELMARIQADWIAAEAEAHLEAGDWAAVVADAQAWDALGAAWPGLDYPYYPRVYRPIAMAHLGDLAGATRGAAALPGDCYRCLITRAEVAELAHDPATADHWFAAAAAQGPSLAFAETAWGRILLARGKPDLAIDKLAIAHRRSPRFADPIAYWGEALLAKGDAKAASEKFAEAAKLTPRWGRLRLKWAEALVKLGNAPDARAQLKAAAGMDLSPEERAELARQSASNQQPLIPAKGGTQAEGGAGQGSAERLGRLRSQRPAFELSAWVPASAGTGVGEIYPALRTRFAADSGPPASAAKSSGCTNSDRYQGRVLGSKIAFSQSLTSRTRAGRTASR